MEGILCKYCRSANVVKYGHYRGRLKDDCGVYPSRSTVYQWITGLTPRAIEATAGFRPVG